MHDVTINKIRVEVTNDFFVMSPANMAKALLPLFKLFRRILLAGVVTHDLSRVLGFGILYK